MSEKPKEDDLDSIFDQFTEEAPKKPEKKTQPTPKTEEKPKDKPEASTEEKEDLDLDDILGSAGEVAEVDEPEPVPEPEPTPKPEATKKTKKVVEKAPTSAREKPKLPDTITEDMLRNIISEEDPEIRTEEVSDEEDRTVYCIIGDKGTSKTTTAMSYDKSELDDDDLRKGDGTVIACISMDRQSNKIANKYRRAYWGNYPEKSKLRKLRNAAMKKAKRKKLDYKHPEQIEAVKKYCEKTKSEDWGFIHTRNGVQGVKEIHVWNGVYYYTTATPQLKTLSAEATYMYLLKLLDNVIAPMNPDYIILDDMEKINIICEMTMRKRNGMSAHEGFKNRNLWKERNDYIDHIFGRCVDHSRVAPIFTTYFKMQEVEDKETGKKNIKEPAWVDRVKKETNTVIHLDYGIEEGKNVWYGIVQSAKDPGWKNQKVNMFTDYEGNGGVRNLMSKHEVVVEAES